MTLTPRVDNDVKTPRLTVVTVFPAVTYGPFYQSNLVIAT